MAADPIQTRRDECTYWLNELRAAKRREQTFREDGARIIDLYAGGTRDDGRASGSSATVPFNILFSNTETLIPAVYSQVPRPVVTRRFNDAAPLGKLAADASQRMLTFLLDTNIDGYETFDEGLRAATLDACLPGRAFTTVKYDADFADLPSTSADDEAPTPDAPVQYATSELVCLDSRVWNHVYIGYAKKWSKVPWIAYEEQIDRKEAVRQFGEAIADTLTYTAEAHDDPENRTASHASTETEVRKTVRVYQIWDKSGGRKVRYLSEQSPDDYLKVEDDPLGLTGFYNCPRPLQFLFKPHDLMPTALYSLYENQAKELNKIQRRINHIVDAMKARGIYDGGLGTDVEKIFQSEENALVPAENAASLVSQGGLDKSIWFMPLDTLQQVLQQLYTARESCKQVIYEITGISDIIRGASKASETLGAQQIKTQWGTLRLKRLQKEVQRYARDLLRIMLEIAATKFSEETWAKMTGLPFLTTPHAHQAQQMVQAYQAQLSQVQAQAQNPAVLAQVQANPQLAHQAQQMVQQLQQQLQQATQQLQTPTWSDVLAVLQDDLQRAYRIDIETNSTIEPEAAEDQQQITELMTVLGQALNGLAPLIAKGILPFEIAKAMLLTIARRFRFGNEIEEFIQQMQAPKPPQDDGAEKAKAEAQLMQQQTQLKAKEAEMGVQMQEMQAQQRIMQQEHDLAMREMELKMREEQLHMQESVAIETMAMQDQPVHTTVGTTDRMPPIKNHEMKRGPHMAPQAKTKVATGVGTVQSAIAQLTTMQAQLLQTVTQQSEQMQRHMYAMMAAMTAPRKKKAIRGKDGRLEGVEETVA